MGLDQDMEGRLNILEHSTSLISYLNNLNNLMNNIFVDMRHTYNISPTDWPRFEKVIGT